MPSCPSCAASLRARYRRDTLLTVLAGCLAGLLALVAGRHLGWNRGLVGLLAVTGMALPFLALQLFFPPPFDMTVEHDTIDYTFADEDYARVFTTLNQIP